MEKGRGKGTDTLQTDNVFMRKEYIEREAFAAEMKKRQDAAKEWLIEANGIDDADGKARAETILSFLCEVKLTLNAIPSADIAPVRHGRWTGHDIGNGRLSIDDDTCSLCGSRFYQIAETGCVWHYCPNCGALMDDNELVWNVGRL